MSTMNDGISEEDFYGRRRTALQEKIEASLRKHENETSTEFTRKKGLEFMNRLLGPSQTWIVFKKQQDAIDCCRARRNGLMCFAFEDINHTRMFLVAHPKVFWARNHHRFRRNCSTYEVIQEYSACKLYLDIEYEIGHNAERNGDRMLRTLQNIINFNLKHFFGIECRNDDILDLDSTTASKFSHHILYEIRNVAFQNNYVVGNFVKYICSELRRAFESSLIGDKDPLVDLARKYSLTPQELVELFVHNDKKKPKIFVDEGVYTKNRHFRLLGSSKQGKNASLFPSESNGYKPIESADSTTDCCLFIDSLVTYFSWEVSRVLEFDVNPGENRGTIRRSNEINREPREMATPSPVHPKIDSFIEGLIRPNGKIRKKTFFSDSSTIVYEIQGYRYCENILREHKSNNIKYVVDLQVLGFYQKCYDLDCSDFRSTLKPLPDEIRFQFEDDSFLDGVALQSSTNGWWEEDEDDHDDQVLLKAVQQEEKDRAFQMDDDDVTEEELGKVLDCTEAMLEVTW